MKPVMKRVKVYAPHCPQCGEKLRGDNSGYHPWECACGVWKAHWANGIDYEIKPKEERTL